MAEITARRAADLILFAARDRGISMTNLKLQKLLYYCQAWHLAILDGPLFGERIEAWVHGPVVPPVFGAFKENRWNPIPVIGRLTIEEPEAPALDHIQEVLDAYGELTGPQLESLTHQEDPWRIARNGIAPDEPSNAVISYESMIAFYRPKLVALANTTMSAIATP